LSSQKQANVVAIKAREKSNRGHMGDIFRGFNFSRNADIGQIGHLWMANRLSSAAHKSNRHGRLTKSPPPAYGIGITFRISGTRPFAKNAPGG